jgi:very-short-patch-repair endonuclease
VSSMSRKIIAYSAKLKTLARELRNRSTLAEVLLWNRLKNRAMLGYDFHRQRPIDAYIVDFFCPELMLAIEIDGNSHSLKGERDVDRQCRLESLGVRFIRFDDRMVRKEMPSVLSSIEGWIREQAKRGQSNR